MVASPAVTDRLDHYLWGVEAELGFLPELAQDWEGEDNLTLRIDWQYEWAELMVQFNTLYDAYAANQMTQAQRERFVVLARGVRDALPLMRRLDLPEPLRPLETVADS